MVILPKQQTKATQMIIETTDNRKYSVAENTEPSLAHCWRGYEVKKINGQYMPKANARMQLVSKAHLYRIVAEG
jgi:hypothetical protein